MAEPYQRPVARIRNSARAVVGTGFLAPRGVIITCAHVVNAALDHGQFSQGRPDTPFSITRKTRSSPTLGPPELNKHRLR